MYAQQGAALRAQRDATTTWSRTIGGFLTSQIREFFKKVGNKTSQKSSAGEKSRQYILYATHLLHWTYVEGIVAPDTLFEIFLNPLLSIVESGSSPAPASSQGNAAAPSSSSRGANSAAPPALTPEFELWYLDILLPYAHDVCLNQSTLRMLFRYCMGRIEQIVPAKLVSAWSVEAGAQSSPSTLPNLSSLHGKLYSVASSLLRVVAAAASDFVVVQNAADAVLDRIADRELIIAHVASSAAVSHSAVTVSSSSPAATDGLSASTTLALSEASVAKVAAQLMPKPMPSIVDAPFREFALEARRRSALFRGMSSPQAGSKLKIIDFLDSWNRFSDMKTFCDTVLDAAQGKANSGFGVRKSLASMTPSDLVNLVCDWAMSPHRAVRDIYPPFVASALLKRLRSTPDWTFKPSDSLAVAPKSVPSRAPSTLAAATPVQSLFAPSSASPPVDSGLSPGAPKKWAPPPVDVACPSMMLIFLCCSSPCLFLVALLLIYLDTLVPLSSATSSELDREFFARMARLFGELARCYLFSHDKYMRSLISRGLMDRPASAEDDRSRRHRRILEELPIFGDNAKDRMQRRMLLYGAGVGSLPTDESMSAPVVAHIEPWISGLLHPRSFPDAPSTEILLISIRSLPLYHQVLVIDKLVTCVKRQLDIDADTPVTASSLANATELLRRTLCLLETQGDFIVLLSFLIWILQDAFYGSEHVALAYSHKYEKLFVCAEQLVELLQAAHDRYDEIESASAVSGGASSSSNAPNASLEQLDKLVSGLVSRHSKAERVEIWKNSSVTNAAIKKRFSEKPMRVTIRSTKPAPPDFETELDRWLQAAASPNPDVIARLVSATSMLQPLMSAIFKAIFARRQHIDGDRSTFSCLLALVVEIRRRFGPDPSLAQAISEALQSVLATMIEDENAIKTLIYSVVQLIASATLPFDQLVAATSGRLREARDMIRSAMQSFGSVPHINVVWQIRVLFDWICLLCCKLDTNQLPVSMRPLIALEDAAAVASAASALLGTPFQGPPTQTPAAPSGGVQTSASPSGPPSLLESAFSILQFIHVATAYTNSFSSGAENLVQEYLIGDALDLSSTFVREVVFSSPANSVYSYVMNLKDPPGSYSLFYRHLLGRSPEQSALPSASTPSSMSLQETLRSCLSETQTIVARTTEWNVRQSWLELQLALDCGIFTEKPTNRSDVKTLQWFARLLMEAVATKRAPAGPVLERIVSFLVPQAQSDILALVQEIFDDRSVLDGTITLGDAVRTAGRRVWASSAPATPATPGSTGVDNLDEVSLADTLLNILSQLSATSLPDSKKRQLVEKTAAQLDAILTVLSTTQSIPRHVVIARWAGIRRQIYLRCALLRRLLVHSRDSNLHLHLSLPPAASEMLLGSLLRLLIHPVVQSTTVDSLDVMSALLYAIDAFMGESGGVANLGEEKNAAGPRSILLKMDDAFLRSQLVSNPLLRARLEQVVPSLERREGLVFNSLSRDRSWMLNKISNPAGSSTSLSAATPAKLDPWLHLLETESEPFIHGDVATALSNVPALRQFNIRVLGPRKELTYAKGLFDEQEKLQRQQRQRMHQSVPAGVPPARPPNVPSRHAATTHIKEEKPPLSFSYPAPPSRAPTVPQPAPSSTGSNRTFPHLPAGNQGPPMPPSHRFPTPNLPASRPPSMGIAPPPNPTQYGYPAPPSGFRSGQPPPPPPQYGNIAVQLPDLPQASVKRQRDPQQDAEMAELAGYTPADQKQRGYSVKPQGM